MKPIRIFATIVSILLLGAIFIVPTAASASVCPPTGSVWSSSNQFTAEPDNYGGQNYYLNNNQWNMQPTSQQTMYLTSVGGDFGLCKVFQPTGHGVTAAPGIGVSGLPGGNVNSYSTISSTFNEQGFNAGAVGGWQWMYDVWTTAGAGHSNAIEVEVVTDRHSSTWPPPGQTFIATAIIGGGFWDVYTATAIVDGHTYYALYPAISTGDTVWFTSGTIDIMAILTWLHNHQSISLAVPLVAVGAGWEISDVSNGSGGTISGPKVTSFSVTLN